MIESQWTQPTAECPHPEWWHADDAQSAESEVGELVHGFIRALQPEYVVETGTCFGTTAVQIGRALAANGHGRLDTLEINDFRFMKAVEAVAGLPVTVHQVSSLEFIPAAPIGFAWLDSLVHLRVEEFARYRGYLAPGAVVGVHDTAPHFGAIGSLLYDLPGVQVLRLPTPRGVSFLQLRP